MYKIVNLKTIKLNLRKSSIYKELYKARNVRPGFKYGFFSGLINTFIDQKIFRGKAPWTLKHEKKKTMNP